MKLIMLHSLVVCLFFMVGYPTSVHAVTDAELEALEKQIEQQEVEEIQRAKVEAKKKAEAEAKRKAEVEKQRLEEMKQIAEEKRMAETRLAELERQRQEEAKKRAEEEKKEKYNLLIAKANQAMSDRDKVLAISIYNEALALYPGDAIANSGIIEVGKLKHKVCYEVLGNWGSEAGKVDIKEDGTFTWDNGAASGSGTWECSNPKAGEFDFLTPSSWIDDWTSILNEDGRCLSFWNKDCWTRQD